MSKLTRYLATRLRRFAFVTPASATHALHAEGRAEAGTSWKRLDAFITFRSAPAHVVRERELVQENARAAIALIGQDGDRFVRRVAQLHESGEATSSEPALLALALAHAHGDASTRDEALRALARVARVNARLTPGGVRREGGRRGPSRRARR